MNLSTPAALVTGAFAGIRGAIAALVVVLFVVMMTAVLVQISGRYIFNYSISGVEEVATFSQIWLVLFGAGIAMRRGQHVVVDVLALFLPVGVRRVISVIVALGSIVFVAIVARTSLALVNFGFIQSSPALQIPMWIVYLCLPAGSIYLILEIVAATWADLNGHSRYRDTDSAEGDT